jgi:hypothetical protein
MKNLHKLYNHYDIPWVNLIRKAYYERFVPHAISTKDHFDGVNALNYPIPIDH